MREDHPVAARPLCDLDRQHGETPNEDRCFTRSRYGNPWSAKLGTTSTIAFSDEHLRSLYYGKEKAVISEIYPLDERDSSFPSQEDVESILASFEFIETERKGSLGIYQKGRIRMSGSSTSNQGHQGRCTKSGRETRQTHERSTWSPPIDGGDKIHAPRPRRTEFGL